MLDQSFSYRNFRRLLTQRDFWKYGLSADETEIISTLTEVVSKLNDKDFSFSALTQVASEGKIIYKTSVIEDEFGLRKLNDNLKRLYKFKQANRFLIIEQIKSLLLEEIPMSIVKLDIEQFYETINKEKILNKLLGDTLLSYHSKQVLKKLFEIDQISITKGLPRGISISAALSEIIMRDFDKKVAQELGVYFYARYVDDIIIFTYKRPQEIADKIGEMLAQQTGLKLNSKKTKIIQRQCRCKTVCSCNGECRCVRRCKCKYDKSLGLFFEYLGYRFAFPDIPTQSSSLEITLADKKIKRIKKRTMLSFLDFIKNKNFDLLESRIAFLTSNYVVKSNNLYQTLNAGVYYNYPHINEAGLEKLDLLTAFLRKTINAKRKSFGNRLSINLSDENRKSLSRYCFKSGFVNRKLRKYTPAEINQIKKCWVYE